MLSAKAGCALAGAPTQVFGSPHGGAHMPHRITQQHLVRFLTIGACAAVAACSTSPTESRPARPRADGALLTIAPPPPNKTTVCKVGPTGNYTFTVSAHQDFIQTDGWNGQLLVSN